MWQTAHLLTGHGAMHLFPLLRSMRRHLTHSLMTGLSNPSFAETLLLAAATIVFVLACLGLMVVGASYTH
jgi:hypothetical protein